MREFKQASSPKKNQYASKMFHWQASFLEKGIAPSFPAGTSTFWILLFKHASEANFYFLNKENSRVTTESCWEKKAISQLETSRAVHTPRSSVFFKLFVVNTYPIDAMCCKGNCEENLHIDLWVPLSEQLNVNNGNLEAFLNVSSLFNTAWCFASCNTIVWISRQLLECQNNKNMIHLIKISSDWP